MRSFPCRWERCSGTVPLVGGACSACGQVQPARGVAFAHPRNGKPPQPQLVVANPDELPAITVASSLTLITITVPHSDASAWALAHRLAAGLYDAKARDAENRCRSKGSEVEIAIKRGRQAFCLVVEIVIPHDGSQRQLWVERALTLVPTMARDAVGRPTHRAVTR